MYVLSPIPFRLLRFALLTGLCFVLARFATSSSAAPSGGPYGPVDEMYAVPANAAHVHYVAPDGRSDSGGASVDEPTTIESALARAVTGDVIVLRGGVYRSGNLKTNQGITLQPYRDEHPVFKGTRLVSCNVYNFG